ncbi:NBS-LRR type resistance protein [Cucumis melo var. makuwa]|uniref:NBS-LRR type resistance protein n=1 Tax=Cucumis melo var. makuwa TaxID=1194695 RepID=A0A5A7TMU2_CUCMM|nr:NBS-LRR type resistance protein [Cucumis melo var. makuwa]
MKRKHKIPMARHGHFWSLASLPLPLPLPLPEKYGNGKSDSVDILITLTIESTGKHNFNFGWREEPAGRLETGEAVGLGREAARQGCTRLTRACGSAMVPAQRACGSIRTNAGTARVAEKRRGSGRLHAVLESRACGSSFQVQATLETKRAGRGSNAEWLDTRSTAKRLDARSTVVMARQQPTTGGEVLTETRLLDNGFQVEETRVGLRFAEDERLEARVDERLLGCAIGWSSGFVEHTHQSRDPKGCTYQSSDPKGYTYQSSDLEGCTYPSSDPEGCTYQSSDPEGCTYQSSDPERCTYQSSDPEGYTYP